MAEPREKELRHENSWRFSGNLGQDADVRDGQYGRFVILSVAINRNVKVPNTDKYDKRTLWTKVLVRSPGPVEQAAALRKGMTVLFENGRIEENKWTTQEGQERVSWQVVLQYDGTLAVLKDPSERPAEARASVPATRKQISPVLVPPPEFADDIPF